MPTPEFHPGGGERGKTGGWGGIGASVELARGTPQRRRVRSTETFSPGGGGGGRPTSIPQGGSELIGEPPVEKFGGHASPLEGDIFLTDRSRVNAKHDHLGRRHGEDAAIVTVPLNGRHTRRDRPVRLTPDTVAQDVPQPVLDDPDEGRLVPVQRVEVLDGTGPGGDDQQGPMGRLVDRNEDPTHLQDPFGIETGFGDPSVDRGRTLIAELGIEEGIEGVVLSHGPGSIPKVVTGGGDAGGLADDGSRRRRSPGVLEAVIDDHLKVGVDDLVVQPGGGTATGLGGGGDQRSQVLPSDGLTGRHPGDLFGGVGHLHGLVHSVLPPGT